MIAVKDSVDSADALVDLFDAGEGIRFMLKSFHDITWVLLGDVNGRTSVFALDIPKKVFESFGHLQSAAVYGIRHTWRGDIFYDGVFALTFWARLGCWIITTGDREIHIDDFEITIANRTRIRVIGHDKIPS
jgi:hypothetical protein